jgi:hypothetical protein
MRILNAGNICYHSSPESFILLQIVGIMVGCNVYRIQKTYRANTNEGQKTVQCPRQMYRRDAIWRPPGPVHCIYIRPTSKSNDWINAELLNSICISTQLITNLITGKLS